MNQPEIVAGSRQMEVISGVLSLNVIDGLIPTHNQRKRKQLKNTFVMKELKIIHTFFFSKKKRLHRVTGCLLCKVRW